MLTPYLQSKVTQKGSFNYIHCPEIVTIYIGSEMENELYNKQIEQITERRKNMFARKDFEGYIFATTRPYRFDTFLEILESGLCPREELARLLLRVWEDSENPSINIHIWREMFDNFKDTKTFARTKRNLPKQLTVWRGGSADGLSWTTDKKIADWFAKRFSTGSAVVHNRQIRLDDVVCYLDHRNEKEIVLIT